MSYMDSCIGQRDIMSHMEEIAWKRSGFKNRKALEDAVRDLSLEEKVELLTELNMSGATPNGMATMLFEKKQKFLLGIGQKTWVDSNESYEYAKKTFASDEWKIDKLDFHPICVFSGTHVSQMNSYAMERMTKARNGK